MRTIKLFLLAASVMLAACAKDVNLESANEASNETILASIENTPNTRVQINEHVQTVWTEGDFITVFGPGVYRRYDFTGKTGDRAGLFTASTNYGATNGPSFYDYFAVYSPDEGISYKGLEVGDNEVAVTFPVEQHYIAGSYGTKANVMAGRSLDAAGKSFSFQNMCAYLRVSLTGVKSVKRLELMGNNDEIIAGLTYFNRSNANTPGFRWVDNYSKSVKLECGEDGVQLSETPAEFHLACVPTNFTKGISVVVTFTDGTVYPISGNRVLDLQRNHIRPMAVIDTKNSDGSVAYIYHKGTVAAAPQIIGGAQITGAISWGDNNSVSIGNVSGDYVYADGKEKHTISIHVFGAASLSLDHMTGIEKIDLSHF